MAGTASWAQVKGTHFIAHLEDGDRFFGKEVVREAERFYSRVATTLGYSDREAWLWGNRCHIYLYENKESYHQQTGRPLWSNAAASYMPHKTVQAYRSSTTFMESELPHEIVHLVFREHIGLENGKVPLWLDEGIALLLEEGDRVSRLDAILETHRAAGGLAPLAAMSQASEGPRFSGAPSAGIPVSLFYAESYSVVKFMVDRYGPGQFSSFLRDLRDGAEMDAALKKNYGNNFQSLASLEEEWQGSLRASKSV